MTTRDKRRARAQKHKVVTEEEMIPLYNEEGMRHNQRVIRQNMEQDRQSVPVQFRRTNRTGSVKSHKIVPVGPKNVEGRRDMPYDNREGIEHNKRVVEMNKEKDKEERMTEKQRLELERRKTALQHLIDFFNTKV